MLPVPEVRSTVVAVNVPVDSITEPAAFNAIVPMLLPEPTLPPTVILPEDVAKLNTSPVPTVIVEPGKVTEPALLIYALALELTAKLVAAVLIALPEAPMLPALEVRSTVVAVNVPLVSVIAPAASSAIVPILPPEPTLPLIVILPDVVAKLRTSPEPTVIVEPV